MNTHVLLAVWLVSLVVLAPGLRAQTTSLPDSVRAAVERGYASWFELYQHLHAHPELSLHEERTAARVAGELRQSGYEVTSGVGGHGVVAVLRNGAGPTVLVRADMDALPVKELTGLPYASAVTTQDDNGREVPVMHACGHDLHMTALVGTARVLKQHLDRWHGTLVLIGQPAEERVSGARRMLADGLFTRFPRPDYCLALHVSADVPAGSVSHTEGYALANTDSVEITVRGVGGHGAFPHKAKDPIVLAAQTVLALQTIASREIAPGDGVVVTVGTIHGGTKANIIPDEVRLQLTVRSYTDEVRRQTIDAIRRIARGLAVAAGLPEDRMPVVQAGSSGARATYNDPQLTQRLAGVWRGWFGEDKVVRGKPVMGAEDFGEYGRTEHKIPICIFWVGAVDPAVLKAKSGTASSPPSLHSPLFAPVPEPTLKTGVTAMTAAVLDLLGGK
ncbi:MAG: amidohydrolase [Verrucomicrobia bacterium]|nr:amidohydrolase [Verrucomicrobiota bacterium]